MILSLIRRQPPLVADLPLPVTRSQRATKWSSLDMEHLGVLSPSYLELDDFLCGQTQVHAVAALELEGTFVELGDGLVHVQHGVLLAHLPDDLQGRGTCSAWGW